MDSIDQAGLRGVFDMLQSHYPERCGLLELSVTALSVWMSKNSFCYESQSEVSDS